MSSTIKTGLYKLQIPDMDWGVAHLYEHLLIRSFHELVGVKGYSPYLYGWVGGETFQDVMFIEYGFYSSAVEQLFANFMNGHQRIKLTALDNEITRLEAEDNVIITVKNRKQLEQMLHGMDQATFIKVDATNSIEQLAEAAENSSVLQEKRSKKSFKQVAVVVGLPSASLEEKALFMRLTPIIFDAIDRKLFDMGLYQNETSWPLYSIPHDAMLAHAIYTVKRGTMLNKYIEVAAKEALKEINLHGHEQELRYFADGFAGTPNWHTFPMDFFRYTGIFTSREQIAKLLTVSNAQSVLQKLKVRVMPATKEHLEVIK